VRRWRAGGHEDVRLSALLDDELTEVETLAVVRHLARCTNCEAELDAVRRAREAVRALPQLEPPPYLFAVAAARARAASRPRRLGIRLATAGAALGGLLGGVVLLAGEPNGTVAPPVETFVVDHVARVGGVPMVIPVDLGR